MPILCSVYGCVNKSNDKSLSFYRFPTVKISACSDLKAKMLAQRTAWLKSLRRKDVLDNQLYSMRVCSIHFKTGNYKLIHYDYLTITGFIQYNI